MSKTEKYITDLRKISSVLGFKAIALLSKSSE